MTAVPGYEARIQAAVDKLNAKYCRVMPSPVKEEEVPVMTGFGNPAPPPDGSIVRTYGTVGQLNGSLPKGSAEAAVADFEELCECLHGGDGNIIIRWRRNPILDKQGDFAAGVIMFMVTCRADFLREQS